MSRSYINYIITMSQQVEERKLHRRMIRDASNPFEIPDEEFRRIFRINKFIARYLCNELAVALRPKTRDGLPVHLKVLTSVRLLGDGGYQRGTGQDHSLCIGQTTVSKYLAQFSDAVIRILLPKWIMFPGTEDQRRLVAQEFRNKYGLPDVLEAIDCTHIAIFPPPHPQGIQYKNRKGYASINTQLVVDVNCRILSINARYPGRVHDQFIFNNSNVKAELRRLYTNRIRNYFLLGDSGYALEPWLMTPILDATDGSPADRYTQWHCQARNCVERTNGYLKGIFRCLGVDRVLHYEPEKASKLIYTCATLYNILVHYRIPMDTVGDTDNVDHIDTETESGALIERPNTSYLRIAQEKRTSIINTHFN